MDLTRRDILTAGLLAATSGAFWVREGHGAPADTYKKAFEQLDPFVEQFMRDMNSPGMTLVLSDRDGVQRVATYGFGDLERQKAVGADELFQIGSISKSFIALVLLQLRAEGKLDLHRPITQYMPWLRIQSAFAPITAHHLLTHTSGLPGSGLAPIFPTDPAEKLLAAYPPGERFHYNNTAYEALGQLAWTLDGREIPGLLRERIFKPLGMNASEPVIDFDMRARTVKSYVPSLSDRPYPRFGQLSEAPWIVITNAAGCIASTPRDMGIYLQMLANRGRGPNGPLVSGESFALFSQRHIKAAEFGPEASYGYGIAVDELDGNALLRHTGGMVSFMSALMVDLTDGIGGFASVNAQQGYRPNAVVQHAIRLMRAARSGRKFPAMPKTDSPTAIEDASDYAGVFSGEHGKLEFLAEANRLFLVQEGRRIALERLSEANSFLASEGSLSHFAFVFGRKEITEKAQKAQSPHGAVVEVSWGGQWYTNSAYDGPREFDAPETWRSYIGHYRNDSPWMGSVRVVLLKGQLTIDGNAPLRQDGDLFRFAGNDANTEWIRFGEIVNDRCMHLKYSGVDLWRVAAS